MAALVVTLRTVYALAIVASLAGGAVAAVAFAVAFAVGAPQSEELCRITITGLSWLIPVLAVGVLCGLAVVYVDPNERHAFRLGDEPEPDHEADGC